MHNITLIEGDGIGPEIADAVVKIIDAAGVKINWDRQSAGLDVIEKEVMLEIKEMSQLIQAFIIDETYNQEKLSVIIDNYKKNEKYPRVLFTKNDNPRFMMRMKKMLKDNLINEAKKANCHKENIEYYIEYYVSGVVSLLIHWFIYGSKLSVDEFSKLVVEITGLESVKILKLIYGKD